MKNRTPKLNDFVRFYIDFDLAAKSVCLELKSRSRFQPREFPENTAIKICSNQQ